MYGLDVERRSLTHHPISRDLANDSRTRLEQGSIVIVAAHPSSMLASVKKQWRRSIRKLHIERARTLNPQKIHDLNNQILTMEWATFNAKPPTDILEADITFATADELIHFAPICKTVYVTYSFPKEKLHMLTSWMPRDGKVIIYGKE